MISRRSLLGAIAAPAVIRTAGLLMPIKPLPLEIAYDIRALGCLPPGEYVAVCTAVNYFAQAENAERMMMEFKIADFRTRMVLRP